MKKALSESIINYLPWQYNIPLSRMDFIFQISNNLIFKLIKAWLGKSSSTSLYNLVNLGIFSALVTMTWTSCERKNDNVVSHFLKPLESPKGISHWHFSTDAEAVLAQRLQHLCSVRAWPDSRQISSASHCHGISSLVGFYLSKRCKASSKCNLLSPGSGLRNYFSKPKAIFHVKRRLRV